MVAAKLWWSNPPILSPDKGYKYPTLMRQGTKTYAAFFCCTIPRPKYPSKLAPKNGESPSGDGRISHPSAPPSNDRLNPPLAHQMNPERPPKILHLHGQQHKYPPSSAYHTPRNSVPPTPLAANNLQQPQPIFRTIPPSTPFGSNNPIGVSLLAGQG